MASNKKINLLISKEGSAPYYTQIPSWVYKFAIYILPIIFLLSLLLFFISFNLLSQKNIFPWLSHKDVKDAPQTNSQDKEKMIALETENHSLREKILSFGPPKDFEQFDLSLIKLPLTFADKTQYKYLSISRWQWDFRSDMANISFQLNNETKSKNLGFLFIIQYSNQGYQVFPLSKNNNILFQKSYLEGSYFNISFFKTEETTFKIPNDAPSVNYLILAFSQNGDLILRKNFGPYSPK